jgi:hypothetical protein
LLLLRAAAGGVVIAEAVRHISSSPAISSGALDVLAIVAAVLLLGGLWTPVVGSLIAIVGLWIGVSSRAELSTSLLLIAIGVALALLGPGVWSVDARLYGWRRIDVRDPRGDHP